MPLAVEKGTLTVLLLAPLRVTTSVMLPALSMTLVLATVNCSVLSSSRMLTVTNVVAPSAAWPVGVPNPTVKVSVGSITLSLRIVTVMVWLATLVPKASEPLVATKSEPASAVPLVVLKGTVKALLKSPVRVTVRLMLPCASVTLAVGALNCTVLSSSVIVTVATVIAPSDASPVGELRPTVNVSGSSTTVSLEMPIVMIRLVTLVAKMSRELVAPPKSEPASAVPLVVL